MQQGPGQGGQGGSYNGMPGLQIGQQQQQNYGQPLQMSGQPGQQQWRPSMPMPGHQQHPSQQQQQQQQQQLMYAQMQQQQQQAQMHQQQHHQQQQQRMPSHPAQQLQHQQHHAREHSQQAQQAYTHPSAPSLAHAPAPPLPQPTANLKRFVEARDISLALPAAEILRQHKRKRPTDRSLPSLAHDETLDSLKKEYEKLVEMEKQLDATLVRKKAELVDETAGLKRTTWRKLRIRISNECHGQEWQAAASSGEAEASASGNAEASTSATADKPDFQTGAGIPKWTVKIEGKLVDLDGVPPAPAPEEEHLPRFSQLVRYLSIDIKRPEDQQYREPNLLNWQPQPNSQPTDGFSFSRAGTESVPISIGLYPTQHPRRYKLAPELGNLLDLREESKVGILTAMWSYIQRERLLENPSNAPEADRRNIKLDESLQRLFPGAQKMTFYNISEAINRYLSTTDPVTIDYTVDPSCADSTKTFEMLIEIPDPSTRSSQAFLQGLSPGAQGTQELHKLDEQISTLTSSIRTSVYQHSLLSKFSANPSAFMRDWMESQSLDLQDMLDPDTSKFHRASTRGEFKVEQLRDSDWFRQDWVQQAVGLHVSRLQAVPPARQ